VFVVSNIILYTFFLGAVCRTEMEIDSYEGPSKKSESVVARHPDILLSDLRSAIATSRKKRKERRTGS
jgi:hypothetical protein